VVKNLKEERIGKTNKNTYGSMMKIIEYNNHSDVWVQFELGRPVHTQWTPFIKGEVTNVYDRSIYNIGFIGEGSFKTSVNGKMTPQYKTWHSMMTRCYSDKYQEKQPTYVGCTVDERWHNFQNFAAWYDQNYYDVEGQRMQLDKDILIKRNKIYSQEKCVFVPQNINKLFIKKELKRGNLPIGVSFHKYNKNFVAQCTNGKGKQLHLGSYDTPEKAFQSHKKYKEELIKQIAGEYKGIIPDRLYDAMISYQVEITD
jgi:hypothetical protein